MYVREREERRGEKDGGREDGEVMSGQLLNY